MIFEGTALPEGCNPDAPRTGLYTVAEIYPEHIVLDGNHPLAGDCAAPAAEGGVGARSHRRGSGPRHGRHRLFRIEAQAPGNQLLH